MKAADLEEKTSLIQTGFPQIDQLFGGGLPTKRIIEIAGSWSVGKSTLAYQIIGAAQKQGYSCLLLDAERAFTKEYGTMLGVNNEELDIFRAKTAEEYLDHIFEWIEGDKEKGLKRHKKGLVVIDAIGALLPREEAEKTSESRSIGLQARIIGSFCRKIVPVLDDNDVGLLILNHTFIPLGQMGVSSSGGKKLEYARSAWLILSGAYGEPIKKDKTGLKTLIPMRIEVKKNKIQPNMGTKVEMELIQGQGFVTRSTAEEDKPPKAKGDTAAPEKKKRI